MIFILDFARKGSVACVVSGVKIVTHGHLHSGPHWRGLPAVPAPDRPVRQLTENGNDCFIREENGKR